MRISVQLDHFEIVNRPSIWESFDNERVKSEDDTLVYKFTAITFRELMKSHDPVCFPIENLLVVHQRESARLKQFETERVRVCIISIFLFIVFGKWFASSAFNMTEVFFLYSFPRCICSISFVIALAKHRSLVLGRETSTFITFTLRKTLRQIAN